MKASVHALALVLLAAANAHARPARVTARTPTTIYVDAGSADGLAPGQVWQAQIAGSAVSVRVVAVATHDSVLALDGTSPAVGTTLELPSSLSPPVVTTLRAPPVALPPWQRPALVPPEVQIAASARQPVRDTDERPTRISGELSLSAYVAADADDTSTSWQDLALTSQLAIESGSWQYDHLLEAHLSSSPAIWRAPLQNADARFDVYLLRLAYAPAGGRYAASFGRQPGAPLSELGNVDGARAHLRLDPQFDVTVFAGLRPASDLALFRAPRAGADVAWHTSTVDGFRARGDVGIAVDQWGGRLDRLQSAAAALVGTRELSAHADATLDVASDAYGTSGARISHTAGFVRAKRGPLTTSVGVGYDRPFLSFSLASELQSPGLVEDVPRLVLAPRTFASVDGRYALRSDLDVSAGARASRGDGFVSTYVDVAAMWRSRSQELRVSTAPFMVLGTLVSEVGVRGDVDIPPLLGLTLGAGGVIDRVTANGESVWAGLVRVHGGRAFLTRWRASMSFEAAAGDGPVRLFMFALLGYRLGE